MNSELENLRDSAIVEVICYASGMISDTVLGEIRIPIKDHAEVSYDYSVSHWFPLYNPKLSKQDGCPGEIGMKIGFKGGSVCFLI